MNPMILEAYGGNVSARLRAQGWTPRQVTNRGQQRVMYYPEADGDKVNRARFTWRHGQTFTLSMADARGRWGETGETGSLDALLTILIEQFGFVLVDWS
jgi:hypothetical protein